MYTAVPDLTKYVAGWTMHPYGGRNTTNTASVP